MTEIRLRTRIRAPIEICFDLSRSIDLHIISTSKTSEKAIDGKTSGLIGLGESVTWEARHLGITQRLTSKITAMKRPEFFADEMVEGAFKSFHHTHLFRQDGDEVVMTDVFAFASPLGILGRIFNAVFLKSYMTRLLKRRNKTIKFYAETENWKLVLKPEV